MESKVVYSGKDKYIVSEDDVEIDYNSLYQSEITPSNLSSSSQSNNLENISNNNSVSIVSLVFKFKTNDQLVSLGGILKKISKAKTTKIWFTTMPKESITLFKEFLINTISIEEFCIYNTGEKTELNTNLSIESIKLKEFKKDIVLCKIVLKQKD